MSEKVDKKERKEKFEKLSSEMNWQLHRNASTLFSWIVDFFCGGSKQSRFQWLHKEQFQNFLELYLRGRIYCFFNKFQLKLLQLNTALLNPHFFEPPDNSKQKSFPSPSSDTNFSYSWFVEVSDFSDQFSFPSEVRKIRIEL